jgi:hypothetical protein
MTIPADTTMGERWAASSPMTLIPATVRCAARHHLNPSMGRITRDGLAVLFSDVINALARASCNTSLVLLVYKPAIQQLHFDHHAIHLQLAPARHPQRPYQGHLTVVEQGRCLQPDEMSSAPQGSVTWNRPQIDATAPAQRQVVAQRRLDLLVAPAAQAPHRHTLLWYCCRLAWISLVPHIHDKLRYIPIFSDKIGHFSAQNDTFAEGN